MQGYHSDGLQLLETSDGNVIMFGKKQIMTNVRHYILAFKSTLSLMDMSYLTAKGNETPIL